MGVVQQGIQNYKLRQKGALRNSKRFFYFGSEMWYYRGRPHRPSPFITLHTHYLYTHTFIQTKSGGTKINI